MITLALTQFKLDDCIKYSVQGVYAQNLTQTQTHPEQGQKALFADD
jgi:hypothetical protein